MKKTRANAIIACVVILGMLSACASNPLEIRQPSDNTLNSADYGQAPTPDEITKAITMLGMSFAKKINPSIAPVCMGYKESPPKKEWIYRRGELRHEFGYTVTVVYDIDPSKIRPFTPLVLGISDGAAMVRNATLFFKNGRWTYYFSYLNGADWLPVLGTI